MSDNTIAAIIPLYNKEAYVGRTIQSVLAQKRPVDEIIVVDDASTDASRDRVADFKDPRIKLIQRMDPRQRGLPATRNVAIRAATSRWTALLDADDTWHPHYIAEIERLAASSSERTALLFTGWQNVWADGTVTRDRYSTSVDREPLLSMDLDQFIATWLRLRSCPIIPSGTVLRRDLLLKAGLFNECCRRGEDKEMWIRMLMLGDASGSPRVSSSYSRGIPGQMDTSISTNARHCLCPTLERMIAQCPDSTRRRLLMRLFNLEVYEYARAVQQRQRVSPEVYRGFYVSLDPVRYLVLLGLSYVPVSLQQMVRSGLLLKNNAFGLARAPDTWS